MPRLELFPFATTTGSGKWVKALYVAETHEIAARYTEWEIIGRPEIRDVDPRARSFTPWKVVPHAELMRISEPPPEMQPQLEAPPGIDGLESFLLRVFLRRYSNVLRQAPTIRADARRSAAAWNVKPVATEAGAESSPRRAGQWQLRRSGLGAIGPKATFMPLKFEVLELQRPRIRRTLSFGEFVNISARHVILLQCLRLPPKLQGCKA